MIQSCFIVIFRAIYLLFYYGQIIELYVFMHEISIFVWSKFVGLTFPRFDVRIATRLQN